MRAWNKSALPAAGWFLLLTLAAAGLGLQLREGIHPRIETNLLELLPESDRNPAAIQALDVFTDVMSRRIVFLLYTDDTDQSKQAAAFMARELATRDSFTRVRYEVNDELEDAFYHLYFPYRFQLLSNRTRRTLKTEDGGRILTNNAIAALNSPLSPLLTRIMEEDPLFLFPAWLQDLPGPPGQARIQEGAITLSTEETTYILVTAQLRDTPFRRETQDEAVTQLNEVEALVRREFPNVNILTGGSLRFAHSSTQQAERDTRIIGTGSMIGILLLIGFSFKSLRWLLVGILPVLGGLLPAFAVSFMVFDKLHIITLGFGASLIGVCIDYTFHYFSDRVVPEHPGSPRNTIRRIFPGVTLGVITSILGYAGLFAAPFPGLRQMALFSSVGLLGAYGTVLCWFPTLCGEKQKGPGPLAQFIARQYNQWRKLLTSRKARWILLPAAAVVIPGLLQLRPDDDIRRLQRLDPDLVAIQQRIGQVSGDIDQGKFLVVHDDSSENVLRRLETLHPVLDRLKQEGAIGYYQTLAQWVPSRHRQEENRALLRTALLETGILPEFLDDLGFDPEVEKQALWQLTQPDPPILTPEKWITSPAALDLDLLGGAINLTPPAAIVPLGSVTRPEDLRQLSDENPAITYVDQIEDYTALFRTFRKTATWLVTLSYLLIFILLILRYGLRHGTKIMIPPVAAVVVTLGILGWTPLPVNIFTMLALLLILGIGIDYTIFFAESAGSKGDNRAVAVAVVISAMSTILSFGLLALSETIFLRSFGLTVWIGLAVAMLLSPLAEKPDTFPAEPRKTISGND